MKTSALIDELQHSSLCEIIQSSLGDDDTTLGQVKIYSGKESYLSETILYVIEDLTVLPQTDMSLTFLLFSSPSVDILQSNYIIVKPTTSTSDVLDFLMDLFTLDQQIDIALQPLIEALLKDYGLQKLSDIAEKILGNPFWIIDMNYNYITKPQSQISDPKIQQEVKLGYILDDTVMWLRKNKTREQIQRLNETFSFQAEGTDRQILMTAVKIKNITVSYINAFEENNAFSDYHFRLMNHIAEIFGAEMQKTSYFKNNKGLMFSYFLTDLLERRLDNMHNILRRMDILGYNMKKYFYILAVTLHNLELREVSLNTINEQIQYIVKDCIYCTYKNHSVFLITKSKTLDNDSKLLKTLNQYLKDSDLSGGISGPVTDIFMIPRCYEKALLAINLGGKFTPLNHLMQYSELALYHFIENSKYSIHFSELCNGAIEKLIQHDSKNHTNLVNTLHNYLNENLQITTAAKKMNLHSNTLRYRLDKIRNIINCTLENGEENLTLLLALKIYDYSGINTQETERSTHI